MVRYKREMATLFILYPCLPYPHMIDFKRKHVMNIVFDYVWFLQAIEIKLYTDETVNFNNPSEKVS